jgi:hypothetical protein
MNHCNIMYILFPLSHNILSGSKVTSLSRYCELESFQWLTLNSNTIMHYLIRSLEGPRYISIKKRGMNSILIDHDKPKTTFTTTQLQSSI